MSELVSLGLEAGRTMVAAEVPYRATWALRMACGPHSDAVDMT